MKTQQPQEQKTLMTKNETHQNSFSCLSTLVSVGSFSVMVGMLYYRQECMGVGTEDATN